jgi:hypothetical protein
MVLDSFTLSNTTEYTLKDFVVGCDGTRTASLLTLAYENP